MTEWVSQSDGRRLLADLGDAISQPALSQYLSQHPEIPQQSLGPGRGMRIDFAALRRSRETRLARGPATAPSVTPTEPAAELALDAAPTSPTTPAPAPRIIDELSRRKGEADVQRAEADARRARVLANEAEGRVINRDVAVNAFMAAGVALTQAFEQHRRAVIDELRAATDVREANHAMKAYETRVRGAFAGALTDLAAAAEKALAA